MVTTSLKDQPTRSPYTTWTTQDRTLLVCLLGYLALASSLTANIYFPLIDLLAERYETSTQAINLTITLYFVFQGIAPSFWSPLSDSFGHRPVYLATFTIYTAASLGLSIVDRSYPALLLLRALQSIGGSAVLSLAYAVVADVAVHSERGRFLAPMLTATNVGPCIGPIIGGGALASRDPRWCFRALLIFGASAVLLIGLVQPETARTVVGNGAVPAKGLCRTWLSLIFPTRVQEPDINTGKTGRGKFIFPNPLPSLRIVFHPDSFLTLWLAGCPYALWFCVQTSITPVFRRSYGFNPLEVGCCFLAGGAGIIAGGFVVGRLMDKNYKHVAKKAGFTIDRVRGDDVARFPIEHARSRWSVSIVVVSMFFVVGYGWAVERRVHAAVPLLLQAYLGCKCTVVHQTYSALIVDVFPNTTGTAAAANNITRCALAAAGVAMLDPLVSALGYGWVFTLLGLFDAISCVLAVVALRRWGRIWRDKRADRLKDPGNV
ncbi:major facilitator superfamily domain-containing protein [Parachaetomium inaequale]|uniref:Major facilitator superfamily domain-containing protein n=1 Tax=Parachaetomium inaequale TaxID=2588326 RepID=A0AAN6P6I7_9PEZI|nr:major facilitator superfamily domain-containing protein [Parachaetomium inaequale]